MSVVEERMASTPRRLRRTLHLIKSYREMSDDSISQLLGMTRSKVNSYISGPTKLTAEMMAAFAWVFRVPEQILWLDPDDALRWVLDNAPNGTDPTPDGGGDLLKSSTKWYDTNGGPDLRLLEAA